MSHRWRDVLSWFGLGGALLLVVHWLGKGTPFDLRTHLPTTASDLWMMVYLLCFVAGLDAILIGLALVVRRPSNAEGSIQDRRHHHAGRINLMAAVALCFSVVGVLMWLLPRYRDEGALVEESPILGGMFVLMGLISAAGMVIAHRRQKLFDRRGR